MKDKDGVSDDLRFCLIIRFDIDAGVRKGDETVELRNLPEGNDADRSSSSGSGLFPDDGTINKRSGNLALTGHIHTPGKKHGRTQIGNRLSVRLEDLFDPADVKSHFRGDFFHLFGVADEDRFDVFPLPSFFYGHHEFPVFGGKDRQLFGTFFFGQLGYLTE